jgi:hypothetical protein
VTPHDPKETPPSIGAARCEVRVAGPLAEVTQTLCIDNPNPRPTSANLVIPLPERAVVCGYALEVAGQLVEGVVVERERARVAFDTQAQTENGLQCRRRQHQR